MQNATWKEFQKNPLTHSGAHYLMAIANLLEKQGYARLSDVAKRLNISKGSLSTSLKPLIKKNLIVEDENRHLTLSKYGEEQAARIKNTYSVTNHFFANILEVDPEIAEVDSCKIEHLLSIESSSAILKLVKVLEKNPKLLKEVREEIKNHKNCSTKGCKTCNKNFCLKK